MLDHLNQKNLLSSSFLVLSLFLLSPEGKAMNEENEGGTQRNFNKPFKDEIILSNVKSHVQKKLNIPFINGDGYKTLPMGYVSTYDQRSKLYSLSGAQYPKIPMIHRYDSDVLPPPFGAAFLGSDVSIPLSLKQYLGPKDQFFFLNIQQHDENDTPLSLKPQYALFPEAPATSNTDHVARVGWTVVPGREGKIIPAEGETKQDLLKESVYIHPSGHEPNPLEMVLSKDVMHLQGISTNKSMDCYSFIDADNANLVTYHWMLTPDDFMKFNQALSVSNTLNELILNLDYQRFLPKLLMELGKYVNYFPQIQPHVQAKLNVPFMSGESQFGDYKNLPMGYVPTYDTRSNLNSLKGCYPKISTIHTDNPDIESPPFGAAFLGSDVSIPLSLKQHLPQKDQFFFLNIQQHDKNDGPLSLKPQYALFPDAPASSQVPQDATVGWTVIPGRKGNIIPEQGEAKETLWKEAVSIHPAGENDPKLILSGNSMRLQGINTKKSMDCYSFIDADNASLVTYHWMLTPHDFRNFSQALSVSDTLNELIYNLDHQQFLPNILMELKRYVKYSPLDVKVPEEVPSILQERSTIDLKIEEKTLNLHQEALINGISKELIKDGKENIKLKDIEFVINKRQENIKNGIQTRIDEIKQDLGESGFLYLINQNVIKLKNLPPSEDGKEKINNRKSNEIKMSTEKNTANSIKNYKFENIAEDKESATEQIKSFIIQTGIKGQSVDNIINKFNAIRSFMKNNKNELKEYYDYNINRFSVRAVTAVFSDDESLIDGIDIKYRTPFFYQTIGNFCWGTIDKIDEKKVEYAKKPDIIFSNEKKEALQEREKNFEGMKFYLYDVSGLCQNCGFNVTDTPRSFAKQHKELVEKLKNFSNGKFLNDLEEFIPINGQTICYIGKYVLGANIVLYDEKGNTPNSSHKMGIMNDDFPTLYFLHAKGHYQILVPVESNEENLLLRAYGQMKEKLNNRLPEINGNNISLMINLAKSQFLNNEEGGWLKSYVDWVKYKRYEESKKK